MAHLKTITLGRTYNDGDYESTRIDITVDLDVGESPRTVFEEMLTHMDRLRKKQRIHMNEEDA